VEVELDNGQVRPSGSEMLPANAHALLTLLDSVTPPAALICVKAIGVRPLDWIGFWISTPTACPTERP